MSHFLDEDGASHYMLNVLKEDFGTLKSFMAENAKMDFKDFEDFVNAVHNCLFDKHCRTTLFPYTFAEWLIFYDKAVIKEMKKQACNIYQHYHVGVMQTNLDPSTVDFELLDIDRLILEK